MFPSSVLWISLGREVRPCRLATPRGHGPTQRPGDRTPVGSRPRSLGAVAATIRAAAVDVAVARCDAQLGQRLAGLGLLTVAVRNEPALDRGRIRLVVARAPDHRAQEHEHEDERQTGQTDANALHAVQETSRPCEATN